MVTVGIPTYNRNEFVRTRVLELEASLGPGDRILLVDNASPQPVSETLADVTADPGRGQKLTIIRNPVNIGGAANILRCIEDCPTEWLWLLGDDDKTDPAAMRHIREVIAEPQHAGACVIKFGTAPGSDGRTETVCTGAHAFIDAITDWNKTLFMSTFVFYIPTVRQYLKYGYHFCYAMAPHVGLVLAALRDGGRCVLSSRQVIVRSMEAPYANYYSPMLPLMGRMTLLDLDVSPETRELLRRKLSWRPRIEFTATYLTIYAFRTGDVKQALYWYDIVTQRLHAGSFKRRLYRFMVVWPRAGYLALRFAYRFMPGHIPAMFGRLQKFVVHDLYQRL